MGLGEGLNGILGMGQQLDGMMQHLLARRDQIGDNGGWYLLIRHFNRRLDHRQNEALNPKAIVPKIAPLSRQQTRRQMIRLSEISEQFRESLLGHSEQMFVVPKRIVGIKPESGYLLLHYFPRIARIYRLRLGNSGPFGAAPFYARQKGLYIRPEQPVFTNQERNLIHLAHNMSDKDDGRNDTDDTDLLVETKPKTKRPPLYKVLLLNDDYTPMEFVVEVLERFFGITHDQAIEIMLTVHKKGLAVVGVFPYEVAETKVTQVMDLARKKQHPLQCTMEKE